MANSYVEYTTAGSGTNGLGQTTFTAPSKFLSINDIRAKGYNGSTWTELTVSSRGTTTVTLSATPTAGSYSKVRIYRATTSQQIIDFQAGARLAESDLDTAYNQGLYVAQEVSEDAGAVGTLVNNNQTLNGTTTVDNLTATGTVTLPNGAISNTELAGSIAANKLAGGIDLTTQITGYATGTHTVAATCSTSGTITLKGAYQTATYVKIGKLVTVTCDARVASVSSPTGAIRLSLPFVVANDGGSYNAPIITHGLTTQSNQLGDFFLMGDKGQSHAHVHFNTTSNLTLQAENSGINTNAEMAFNLTYFTT